MRSRRRRERPGLGPPVPTASRSRGPAGRPAGTHLGGSRLRPSATPGTPHAPAGGARLVLASTSPQRRAILEQLGVPFRVVAPRYEEHDPRDADPVLLVREHALGKARSVHEDGAVTLGADTTVHLGEVVYGKPAGREEAARMLNELAGATHAVVSGLCLLGPGFAAVEHAVSRVTFRPLGRAELDAYLASGEWEGRAGGYAIQGRGRTLVERLEGDYLNVVGLPAGLLLELLARHAPGLLERDS